MSILEAVMEGIKRRKLDEFFQLEEELQKLVGLAVRTASKTYTNFVPLPAVVEPNP
jgi:hypothetical protein